MLENHIGRMGIVKYLLLLFLCSCSEYHQQWVPHEPIHVWTEVPSDFELGRQQGLRECETNRAEVVP